MSIYIQDDKKKTIRHYMTTPKIEKAIETLIKQNENIGYSETYPGYVVSYKKEENECLKQ